MYGSALSIFSVNVKSYASCAFPNVLLVLLSLPLNTNTRRNLMLYSYRTEFTPINGSDGFIDHSDHFFVIQQKLQRTILHYHGNKTPITGACWTFVEIQLPTDAHNRIAWMITCCSTSASFCISSASRSSSSPKSFFLSMKKSFRVSVAPPEAL